MHETAYGNSLLKIQHANQKLMELQEKIQKYDAELKMSSAEAEVAKLSETFDVNLTTDFGEIESVIQQRIDQNRGDSRASEHRSRRRAGKPASDDRDIRVFHGSSGPSRKPHLGAGNANKALAWSFKSLIPG